MPYVKPYLQILTTSNLPRGKYSKVILVLWSSPNFFQIVKTYRFLSGNQREFSSSLEKAEKHKDFFERKKLPAILKRIEDLKSNI